jgi:hypothetical protein
MNFDNRQSQNALFKPSPGAHLHVAPHFILEQKRLLSPLEYIEDELCNDLLKTFYPFVSDLVRENVAKMEQD